MEQDNAPIWAVAFAIFFLVSLILGSDFLIGWRGGVCKDDEIGLLCSREWLIASAPPIVAILTLIVILRQVRLVEMQWRSQLLLDMTKTQDRYRTDTNLVAADLLLLNAVLIKRGTEGETGVDLARNRFFGNSAMGTVRSFILPETNTKLNNLITALAGPDRYADATFASINEVTGLILRDSTQAIATIENVYFQMATAHPSRWSRDRLAAARRQLHGQGR